MENLYTCSAKIGEVMIEQKRILSMGKWEMKVGYSMLLFVPARFAVMVSPQLFCFASTESP